jgi:hypothetical protein
MSTAYFQRIVIASPLFSFSYTREVYAATQPRYPTSKRLVLGYCSFGRLLVGGSDE